MKLSSNQIQESLLNHFKTCDSTQAGWRLSGPIPG